MTPALQSVLSPAGPDARLLSDFSWLLFAAGAALLALVVMLVLAGIARRRGRSWSRRLVIGGGLLLPAPLLAMLMAWSGWQASQLAWPFSATRIQVTVTGHMWWWEVRYRDTVTGREAVLANELRLPVGERVYLALASADVLHAFWVPSLAGKVDMVPGRMHGLTLQAGTPGRYRGQCAEYCGMPPWPSTSWLSRRRTSIAGCKSRPRPQMVPARRQQGGGKYSSPRAAMRAMQYAAPARAVPLDPT